MKTTVPARVKMAIPFYLDVRELGVVIKRVGASVTLSNIAYPTSLPDQLFIAQKGPLAH